jgi:hypothetical protein
MMRKEEFELVHKSEILNWIKTRIDLLSPEDESENVLFESKLVRCVSEYRKLELESIHLAKDFDLRLMNRLESQNFSEKDEYDFSPKRKYTLELVIFSAIFFLSLFTLLLYNIFIQEPEVTQNPKNLTEDELLSEIKQNPEKKRFLQTLENYYAKKGKIHEASEIHSMLEIVSKKY